MLLTAEEEVLVAMVARSLSEYAITVYVDQVYLFPMTIKKATTRPMGPAQQRCTLLTKQADPTENGLWFEYVDCWIRDGSPCEVGTLIFPMGADSPLYVCINDHVFLPIKR